MKKTIAEVVNHDFDNGSFKLYDDNGNETYYEDSDGFWEKCNYDANGNKIYYGNSTKFWIKCEFDKNNNKIYHENSYGF